MHLTDADKRRKINNNMRFLAFNIFNHSKKPNYTRSYDKLKARVIIDWDINISELIKGSRTRVDNMFDIMDSDMLDKVYKSSVELLNMYQEVIERRTA